MIRTILQLVFSLLILGPGITHMTYIPLVANNCTHEAFEIHEYEIGR